MALITSNPYRLAPGNTNEGTLEFPGDSDKQLAIEITTNGFQFNVNGAISADNPTQTTSAGVKVPLTVPRGGSLSYKASASGGVAIISY
jgi:hypothetical protein